MISGLYHHRTQAADAQGIHINEMFRALKRRGVDMKMIALVKDEAVGLESRGGLLDKVISLLPGFVYELMEIGFNVLGILKLYRATRMYRPDFIYERYSIFNIAGCVVSKLTGVPLIEEINAPLAYEKQKYDQLYLKKIAQAVETWIVCQAAFRTVAVTQVLKQILVDNGAIPAKITVMPNGINLDEYKNSISVVTKKRVVLGFTGWFKDWHGLKELIDAFHDHQWHRQGLQLLLVGDGPERERLDNAIIEYGLEEHIIITGAVSRDRLAKMLQEIDVALQPAATQYASPMKLIEYMAAGKAIIAPDQANIRELLKNGENALLFEPGNFADLARQVEKINNSPDLIRTLGLNARKTVQEKPLTWDYNASQVIELLK